MFAPRAEQASQAFKTAGNFLALRTTVPRGAPDQRPAKTLDERGDGLVEVHAASAVRSLSTIDCDTVPHAPTATTRRRCAKCHRRWSWARGGAIPARMGASGRGVWVSQSSYLSRFSRSDERKFLELDSTERFRRFQQKKSGITPESSESSSSPHCERET